MIEYLIHYFLLFSKVFMFILLLLYIIASVVYILRTIFPFNDKKEENEKIENRYNNIFFSVKLDKYGILYLSNDNSTFFNLKFLTNNKFILIESIVVLLIIIIFFLIFIYLIGYKVWEFIFTITGPIILILSVMLRGYVMSFFYYFIILFSNNYFIGSYYKLNDCVYKIIGMTWLTTMVQDITFVEIESNNNIEKKKNKKYMNNYNSKISISYMMIF